MAELGVAASVLQLVDVGTRVVLAISQLATRLREVPAKVRVIEAHVKHLLTLLTELQRNRNFSSLSPTSQDEVKTVLQDCVDHVDQLSRLLEKIISKADDSAVRRGWKAICSVNKERSLDSIYLQIERNNSLLALWLAHDQRCVQYTMRSFIF